MGGTNIELFKQYRKMEIATIPCKRSWDSKEEIYTGKMPCINKWSLFCEELPSESIIESWSRLDNVYGMAFVTGTASNLACIDIDTTDKELQRRLIEAIPYTPCVINGAPDRGGKFLYRLYDTIHEYQPLPVPKIKIPDLVNPRKSAVDLFFGNAYICAPPSLHSEKNNVQHWYSWADDRYSLDKVGIENLPILDVDIVDKIKMVMDGMTPNQMEQNLPIGAFDSGAEGRWASITNLASTLIRNRTPFEKAVQELLDFDSVHHKDRPYFLDKTKGCRTIDPRLNAIKYYADMLSTINSKKVRSVDLETPSEVVVSSVVEGDYWPEPTPLESDIKLGEFNPDWIPEEIRPTIMSSASSAAVSPQSVFFYMLGTFSSLIGNKAIIQPYQVNKSYTETSNLYVGLIAKSGERKTETTKMARRPLLELEKSERDYFIQQGLEVEKKNEAIGIAIKKLKKDAEKEIFDNGIESEYGKQIDGEIAELEKQMESPRDVSLYEQYNTAERLYEIAQSNPTGLFLEFNEWGAMYDQLLRQESKNLRRFIMDGWDGNNPFKYGTKHNGNAYIERLCLSVGFSIQEDVMSSVIWRMLNIGKENDGLMQRFLLVPSDSEFRPVVDQDVKIDNGTYDIFKRAYFMDASSNRTYLSPRAYQDWMDFQTENKRKRIEEKIPALESFLSKYDGYIIRIASNLAHIASKGEMVDQISHEHFERAKEMIGWLESGLRVLFDQGVNKKYQEIINRLKMSIIPDGIKVRDLCRQHKGIFSKDSGEAMSMLSVLHEHDYIKVVKEGKSYEVRVNPLLVR